MLTRRVPGPANQPDGASVWSAMVSTNLCRSGEVGNFREEFALVIEFCCRTLCKVHTRHDHMAGGVPDIPSNNQSTLSGF